MDKDKINKTIEYYNTKMNGIVNFINSSNNLINSEISIYVVNSNLSESVIF